MPSISEFMTREHRGCDEKFANAETRVDNEDWEQARDLTREFLNEMERHFTMEEQVLFPAFEQQTGIIQGPTSIMREEHQQMRRLLMQLQWALDEQQRDEFLGTGETLLIMMQQHNMKEEGMLYPMCDQQLADVAQIIKDMEQVSI
jgi:hemerythrin-like domain-containing protein